MFLKIYGPKYPNLFLPLISSLLPLSPWPAPPPLLHARAAALLHTCSVMVPLLLLFILYGNF
jgi:hypothetical protein